MFDDDPEEPYHDPALISSLWEEWVVVVCGRKGIPNPTTIEWVALKKTFHYDKAPVDSVAELEKMRTKK